MPNYSQKYSQVYVLIQQVTRSVSIHQRAANAKSPEKEGITLETH